MNNLTLQMAKRTFECYVLPSITYGIALWHGNCSKESIAALNTVHTNFFNRNIGLPYNTNNAMVLYVTSSASLQYQLRNIYHQATISVNKQMTRIFPNMKLDSTNNVEIECENLIERVPAHFWMSKVYKEISALAHARKKLFASVFDLEHFKLCMNEEFHHIFHEAAEDQCICRHCGHKLEHYHQRFNCNPFVISPSNDVFSEDVFSEDVISSTNDVGSPKEDLESFNVQTDKFLCTACNFSARDMRGLVDHINFVHDKIKYFRCDKCKFSAKTQERLEKHIKVVHLKMKDFKCTICGYETSQQGRLNTHIQIKHNSGC